MFFGLGEEEGRTPNRPLLTSIEIKRAKEICRSCPVIVDCYEYAVENEEPAGVWGGTTPRERQRDRKSLRVG